MGLDEKSMIRELQNHELPRDEAIRELRDMRRTAQELYKGVSRKRSWKPAERAMAKATYARQDSALLVAILALERVGL